jgi:N-dimethylarginine dimethylaminohydrolase
VAAVILKTRDLSFDVRDLQDRVEPRNILMCSPDYFNVSEALNSFMLDNDGHLHRVDTRLAYQQWTNVRFLYESLGHRVFTIRGEVGMENMVFTANQSFPYFDMKTQKKSVIMSNMRKDKRKREVIYFEAWYRKNGYEVHHLRSGSFESMGDALWFPGKYLILSGYGSTVHHRTDLEALEQVSQIIGCPVVGIHLRHEHFYHLNTTLSIVDPNICVVYKPGVGKEGLRILEALFKHIVVVQKREAYAPHFACNAFSPDGTIVFIQNTATATIKALEKLGKRVIGVDTSEYIKSGGSVFCMKMQVF